MSPWPTGSSAGMHRPITSTSLQVARTRSLRRSPSRVLGRCRPGVSTSTSCDVRPVQHAADDVPGGLRLVGGDRDLLTDDRVGQGRLAGVRAADEAGEAGAIGTHLLTLSCRGETAAFGQGSRCLPRRRRHRSGCLGQGLGLRRHPADTHSGQRQDPHGVVAVVVRAASRHRAQPRHLHRCAGRIRRAGHPLPSPGDGSGGVRGARLPDRLGSARLQGARRGFRGGAAAGPGGVLAAARGHLHPQHQGPRPANTTSR